MTSKKFYSFLGRNLTIDEIIEIQQDKVASQKIDLTVTLIED